MLLSIEQDSGEKLLIELDSLDYLNVAGMPRGSVWSHGGTYVVDGVLESKSWEDILVKTPGAIVVKLLVTGQSTPPVKIEKKKVSDILAKIKKKAEDFNKSPDNETPIKPLNKRVANDLCIKVEKNGKKVFKKTGKHVQFEIDWKKGEGCKITVWGQPDSNSVEGSQYTDIVGENVYTLRFEG